MTWLPTEAISERERVYYKIGDHQGPDLFIYKYVYIYIYIFVFFILRTKLPKRLLGSYSYRYVQGP